MDQALINKEIDELREFILNNPKLRNVSVSLLNEFKFKLQKGLDSYHSSNHETVKIKGIPIDKNIAELIREIWKANIITYNSCENNVPSGYVWIEFASSLELEKFLKIVFINDSPTKYDILERSMLWQFKRRGTWRCNLNISVDFESDDNASDASNSSNASNASNDSNDSNASNDSDDSNDSNDSDASNDINACDASNEDCDEIVTDVRCTASLRFPIEDYSFILGRFIEYNQ
jgi:hypothetical protein